MFTGITHGEEPIVVMNINITAGKERSNYFGINNLIKVHTLWTLLIMSRREVVNAWLFSMWAPPRELIIATVAMPGKSLF